MDTPGPIRILVVDDHALFRRGLVSLLMHDARFAVVGEAADASQAQRCAQELQPDVILLDNSLPGVRGIDAIAGLREAVPASRMLMLTISEDGQDLASALRCGAQGYLLKTIDGDMLACAIVRAMEGNSVVSPEMTDKLVELLRDAADPALAAASAPQSPFATLSPREHEILMQIVDGASNKSIARAFDIAETTVKAHVQHILRKLGMRSRVQAAVYAAGRTAGEASAARQDAAIHSTGAPR